MKIHEITIGNVTASVISLSGRCDQAYVTSGPELLFQTRGEIILFAIQ
jgi:hypothetical protein